MYKKRLLYVAILCGAFFANQLDTKSCKSKCDTKCATKCDTKCNTKKCKTKCCVTPSSPTFDCIQQFTDFIIVGFGTGGAVLARELSEPLDGVRCNVTVLEAGQNRSQDPVVESANPFAFFQELLANPKFSYTFGMLTGNQAVFDNDGIVLTQGRMWGGISGHNFLTAVRGTRFRWDEWAAILGPEGVRWAYNNLLPFMRDLETYTATGGGVVDPQQRGQAGLLSIVQSPFNFVSTNLFNANIMTQLPNTPLPFVDDYNAALLVAPTGSIGVTQTQGFTTNGLFVPGSQRTHSQNSFCPTPLDIAVNPNAVIGTDGRGLDGRKLQIVSNAEVCRIIFDGTCAVGVEYILNRDKDRVFTLFARKEVILCAGAANNPAILQRSGVGPQSVLDPLGIDAVVYNDNVGANLKNHYGSSCIMTAITNPNNIATDSMFFSDAAPYFNNGQASDAVRRIQSIYSAGPFNQGPLAVPFALIGPQVLDPVAFPTNSFLAVALRPQATGTVIIPSTDCTVAPIVTYGFWDDFNPFTDPPQDFAGSDFDVVVSFFKIIRDAAHLAGELMIYPTEDMFAAADAGNDLPLIQAAAFGTTVFAHYASTCKMAISADSGVCGPDLRVFGTKNLRCADLSVCPFIPDGHTAFPVYYIARLAAALIRQEV